MMNNFLVTVYKETVACKKRQEKSEVRRRVRYTQPMQTIATHNKGAHRRLCNTLSKTKEIHDLPMSDLLQHLATPTPSYNKMLL